MVVTGDPDQSDLLDGLSGLAEIARRVDPIADIVPKSWVDCVPSWLVARPPSEPEIRPPLLMAFAAHGSEPTSAAIK